MPDLRIHRRLWLALLLGTTAIGLAETQNERDLRAKLLASETARSEEQKKSAALEQAIVKLSASNTRSISDASKQAIESAKTSTDSNTTAIQQSADSASYSAALARAQADQLRGMLDSNFKSTVVIQVSTVLLAGLAFWGAQITAGRDRRWAKADADEKSKVSEGLVAQIKQVHTLVNSNMTAAKEHELTALQAQLVLLKSANERVPTAEAPSVIAVLEKQIAELAAQLTDRKKQTKIAAEQFTQNESRIK